MSLAESQISFFYENGYLRLENVLDKEDLQPVIDEYSNIIDKRAQKLYADGKVNSLYADEPFTRRVLCLAKEAPEAAANLDIMQERGEATFNFLKNPKVLDVAESMTDSTEIVCNPIQHIRAVLPHRGESKPTHWHQDAGVCWPDADPYFMLTIWVPIVDATLENGCLQVMPRSHQDGLCMNAPTVSAEERPSIEPLPLPRARRRSNSVPQLHPPCRPTEQVGYGAVEF